MDFLEKPLVKWQTLMSIPSEQDGILYLLFCAGIILLLIMNGIEIRNERRKKESRVRKLRRDKIKENLLKK